VGPTPRSAGDPPVAPRERLKKLVFRLLGKDPEAVVVCFATGNPELSEKMSAEIRDLLPDRQHIVIRPDELKPASIFGLFLQVRRRLGRKRIGLAPVLFDGDPSYRALRLAAWLKAPTRILAYNRRLERHHLRLRTMVASWLFVSGVPLDRIFLRPTWLVPWKKDRSEYPARVEQFAGRPMTGKPAVAVVTPYFPYPLSHGGAVRIFNLLRQMATEFDIFLFAFRAGESEADLAPVLELCTQVILAKKPRYREPRWSTLLPPEVCEFRSEALSQSLKEISRQYNIRAVQIEFTALAPYCGHVLVEHDVTFALYQQVWERTRTLSAWWDYWRWRRFETRWVRKYPAIAVMSEQDRKLLNAPNAHVIPNGVDLDRFSPEPEPAGSGGQRGNDRLLFIGSFRHFPNVVAFRFFFAEVWPKVTPVSNAASLTVVAGAEPLLYWREFTGENDLPRGDTLQILGYTADVRPLYNEANIVVVPTLESAGTNLKVLEALAMQRAVVSTATGCQGLGLTHGENVWIADTAADFAAGIARLLEDMPLRLKIAAAGRDYVRRFDWKEIGVAQNRMLRNLLPAVEVALRPLKKADLTSVLEIERASFASPQWYADDFTRFDSTVALVSDPLIGEVVAGFLVSRQLVPGEREILNVAVHPAYLRRGVAKKLIRAELARWPGAHFLEVRESNSTARQLYQTLGFEQVGTRPEYYDNPPETGIVMRIFS